MDFNGLMEAAKAVATSEEITIDGVGTVTVRGLTRGESLAVGKADGDPTATEATMLRFGLVDPALTESQIKQWLAVAPNDHIDPITRAIARLSGMLKDSPKTAFKSPRDRTRR